MAVSPTATAALGERVPEQRAGRAHHPSCSRTAAAGGDMTERERGGGKTVERQCLTQRDYLEPHVAPRVRRRAPLLCSSSSWRG